MLDKDFAILKDTMKCHDETTSSLQSQLMVSNNKMLRQAEDWKVDAKKLMDRVDKAEHDRMDKYYKQVS